MRILHLSDIHLDTHYKVDSNAACSEPLCCRTSDGMPSTSAGRAGYWGATEGTCDIPERTLDNLFTHLSKNEQVCG